jgi:hypothetical protein
LVHKTKQQQSAGRDLLGARCFWLLASPLQTTDCKHGCFCRLEPSVFKTICYNTVGKLQKGGSNSPLKKGSYSPAIQQYG